MKLAVLAAVLLVQALAGTGPDPAPDAASHVMGAATPVALSGWFHIVWNGEPRFFLVDDRGVATRLVIDESVMRAFGGPRGLNNKRVTIEGQRMDDMPEVVRVLSLEVEVGVR